MENPDLFQFVFDIFKDVNKSYFRNVMSTLGFVLLAIGWIVTSEKSRSFLGGSNTIRRSSIAEVAVIALIHTIISVGAYFVSAEKFEQLRILRLDYVKYFEIYKLNAWHVALNLVMNLSVFVLLILLISKTKEVYTGDSNFTSEPKQQVGEAPNE